MFDSKQLIAKVCRNKDLEAKLPLKTAEGGLAPGRRYADVEELVSRGATGSDFADELLLTHYD